MKVTDVRVGNIFEQAFIKDNGEKYNKPVIIHSIDFNHKSNAYEFNVCDSYDEFIKHEIGDVAEIEDLIPIVVTEEWIIKFGFKKDIVRKDSWIEPGGIINSIRAQKWHIYDHSYWALMDYERNNPFSHLRNISKGPIKVHEFQNLFSAIMGRELEVKNL